MAPDPVSNLAARPKRFGAHHNAFGFLRLLFASLVIVSHTPELVDGDRNRELLTLAFGTTSFGGLAVNGFFIISGFLITGSLLNSKSVVSYLVKRVARIYPAFVVASVICLTVVAPLAGADAPAHWLRAAARAAFNMAMLARPAAQNAFSGQHYNDPGAALDGAMWTIQYEFACYLLIVAVRWTGLLSRKWAVGSLALASLAIATVLEPGALTFLSHDTLFPGPPASLFTFAGMFLTGSTFYLYRDAISIRPALVGVAAIGWMISLAVAPIALVGFAVFGGYAIFGAARLAGDSWLGRINDKDDISYGLYLYAWPVEQLLIRFLGGSDLVLLGISTWSAAVGLGWLSWRALERPATLVARRWTDGLRSTHSARRVATGPASAPPS